MATLTNSIKLPFADDICAVKGEVSSIVERIQKIEDEKNLFPEVAPETKSRFRESGNDELVLDICKDGFVVDTYALIPSIIDVRHIDDERGIPKVVFVRFADNTTTKAVLDDCDICGSSIETAISICITKKLLDARCNNHGSAAYNKIIRHAVKVMIENEEAERRMRYEEELMRKRALKRAEKRKAKARRREEALKENIVDMISSGIVRAMSQLSCKDGADKAVGDRA